MYGWIYTHYNFVLPGKSSIAVLEKDGEDQLDRSVRKKEVLHRVKKERNTLNAIKRRKPNWTGSLLRSNFF